MTKFQGEHLSRSLESELIMKLLRCLIPFGGLMVLTGLLMNFLMTFHLGRVLINLLLLFALLLSWVLLKRGAHQRGLRVLLLGVLLVFCTSVLGVAGVMTPNYLGFTLIIVSVSVLSSRTSDLFLSYLGFVLVGALTFIPALRLYDPPSILSPFRIWTIDIVYGLSITVLLHLARQARVEMLKELRHRETQLSSIFSSISDPLIVSDIKGGALEMNPSAETLDQALLEQTGRPLLETPLTEIHNNETLTLQSLISQGSQAPHRLQVKLEGERPTWYAVSLSLLQANDQPTGVVIFLKDLTDQYHLMQAQKMSAMGVLANGIAHDFNNMLGAIQNATELLGLDLEGEEPRELLEIISEATQRSSVLVSQLRQFSNMSPTSLQRLTVQELLTPVIQQLQRVATSGQQLSLTLEEGEQTLRGDEPQLRTALFNLGLNALQSLQGGGRVTLRSYTQTLAEEACKRSSFSPRPGLYLCFEVQDDGVGIDPEIKERIFEPFFTTKAVGKGTGLGLSTVYGAAQSHQGLVECESALGRGSTFRLYLPLSAHSSQVEAAPSPPSTQQEITVKRVLIIDDEHLIRRSLQGMLEALGVEVSSAESGLEGFKRLAEGVPFDLIILDMQMPERSGREVFYELQETHAHIPVVISSGFSPEGVLEELSTQGLAGVLSKPYRLEELKEALRQVSALKSEA